MRQILPFYENLEGVKLAPYKEGTDWNMGWPRLVINENKLRENVSRVVKLCEERGIKVAGVTKGLCAHPVISRALYSEGCSWLADSRLDNLVQLRTILPESSLMLLRIPMPSEIPLLTRYTDCSLVSMPQTVSLIDSCCQSLNCRYKVIVMCDLGDLREGILAEDIPLMVNSLKNSSRVDCIGIGVNFGCFGGVLPSEENLSELISVGKIIEKELEKELTFFSGGATSSLFLIEEKKMPLRINQLRIGEAFFLGTDTSGMRIIPYLNQDVMHLEAEIIEVRTKPSRPFGKIGADAFGNVPDFPDRGNRRRAIVAIGKQDVRIAGLHPFDDSIEILGASSDHIILDVENSNGLIEIGNILKFTVDYGAMLALATSPYVEIDILHQAE